MIFYLLGLKFKFLWYIVRKCFLVLCNIVWGCGKRLDVKFMLLVIYKIFLILFIIIFVRGESNFEFNNYLMVFLYEYCVWNNFLFENNKFFFWDYCGFEFFVNEKRLRLRLNIIMFGFFFDVNINLVYCFLIFNKLCLKLFMGVLWMFRFKKRCWFKFRDIILILS